MATSIRTARTRHIRHREFKGLVRGAEGSLKNISRLHRLQSYLLSRTVAILATGTIQVFTADFANDEIDIAAHGHADGAGPFILTTVTTLPAGLELATLYFVNAVDAGSLTLHRTFEDAINGTNIVPFADAGTGAHSLVPAETELEAFTELMRQKGLEVEEIRDAVDMDLLVV